MRPFLRESISMCQLLPFGKVQVYKQVCVIPFRWDFLLRYTTPELIPLEQAESIDMLRTIEHGYSIRLVKTEYITQSVDTQEDLARVETLMQNDPLFSLYSGTK